MTSYTNITSIELNQLRKRFDGMKERADIHALAILAVEYMPRLIAQAAEAKTIADIQRAEAEHAAERCARLTSREVREQS